MAEAEGPKSLLERVRTMVATIDSVSPDSADVHAVSRDLVAFLPPGARVRLAGPERWADVRRMAEETGVRRPLKAKFVAPTEVLEAEWPLDGGPASVRTLYPPLRPPCVTDRVPGPLAVGGVPRYDIREADFGTTVDLYWDADAVSVKRVVTVSAFPPEIVDRPVYTVGRWVIATARSPDANDLRLRGATFYDAVSDALAAGGVALRALDRDTVYTIGYSHPDHHHRPAKAWLLRAYHRPTGETHWSSALLRSQRAVGAREFADRLRERGRAPFGYVLRDRGTGESWLVPSLRMSMLTELVCRPPKEARSRELYETTTEESWEITLARARRLTTRPEGLFA